MREHVPNIVLPGPKILFLVLGISFAFSSCHHKKDVEDKISVKSVPSSKVAIVAQKLSISEKEVRNKKLYSFISDWYGTVYKYGGCDKNGVDCSCFTGILYKKVYGVTVGRNTTLIYKEAEHIKTSQLREGDLVFFNAGTKDVSHVGVYLKDNKFVHASTSKGVMINDLGETYYKKYYYGAGRVKLNL
jgi:murein DD-endopeptidase / murein LD-carboxypeptidase